MTDRCRVAKKDDLKKIEEIPKLDFVMDKKKKKKSKDRSLPSYQYYAKIIKDIHKIPWSLIEATQNDFAPSRQNLRS